QWNLTVQREVHKNTTVELSYVGNKGNHLLKTYDANQVREGDNNGDGVPDRLEYARGDPDDPDALGALRPYSVFGDHGIGLWDHSGTSIYHALQSQVISRFGHGSQFHASYTWSRTISNIALDNS